MEREYLTTPFELEKIKREGELIGNFVPTENFFVPMIDDLDKISDFLEDCKTTVDVGAGYGLLITSLSKLNPTKEFLGIDTVYWKQNNFPIPEEKDNLKFEFNGIEAMADYRNKKIRRFDCSVCSWMPMGSDWREAMATITNKKIILILSKEFNTGTLEVYTGLKKFGYELVGRVWHSGNSLIQLWKNKGIKNG